MTRRSIRVARDARSYRRHLFIAVAIVVAVGLALAFADLKAFAFLLYPTGWPISLSFIPYSGNDPYWWAFLVGLTNTVVAGSFGIVGATLIGFVVGAAPLLNNTILRQIARGYTDTFRNIPLILQAMFWYAVLLHLPSAREAINIFGVLYISSRGVVAATFANNMVVFGVILSLGVLCNSALRLRRNFASRLAARNTTRRILPVVAAAIVSAMLLVLLTPHLLSAIAIDRPVLRGLNFRGGLYLTPEFSAVVIAIVVYRGAFMSEIFRGGFTSTARGQVDAAKSLGLGPITTLFTIRLPIALVHVLPPLTSEYINILKVTAIGIIVGFPDLFWVSSNATNQTGKPIEVLCIMIAIYLALNGSLAALMNAINNRVRARGFN
jgi:His/Glu/Gln/Arg/opine family amino acid ABC transporter permease subunit